MAGIGCDDDAKRLAKAMVYLNDIFKYTDFKNDMQKKVIAKILQRKNDVITSLPDGYGRALCYQLPAAMHIGYQATLIFHTLDDRTQIRVEELRELGIPCAILDENTLIFNNSKILKDLANGTIRPCLIYVSLEVACMENIEKLFTDLRNKKRLAYVVVDETHGKQFWLNDKFVHVYEKLGNYRMSSPEIPWIVISNKVHKRAAESLQSTLKLKYKECGYGTFFAPVFRPNIYYECIVDDFLATSVHDLKKFVNQNLISSKSTDEFPVNQGSGLIFCKNPDLCVEIASELRKSGILIAPFYGGLSEDEQRVVVDMFMKGFYQVLTVTNYTGRGMDKPDLRFIVHWGLPSSIMCYYNNTALAGKDGNFARCRIYVTEKSLKYYDDDRETELRTNAEKGDENSKLKYVLYMNGHIMKDYCVQLQCRNKVMAEYFGDLPPKCIDKCDICESVNKGGFVIKKAPDSKNEPKNSKRKIKALTKMMESTTF